MIIASFAELFSIGAVIPFLAVLTSPDRVFQHSLAQPFIQLLDLSAPDQLLWPLTVLFCLAIIIAASIRLLLLHTLTNLSFATGSDLAISMYRRTLYQPYAVHVARNSSSVIDGISTKAGGVIFFGIQPVLTIISTAVTLILILFALLSFEPVVTLEMLGGLGLIYAIIIRYSRKKLRSNGHRIARETTHLIKSLQEGLGGIRDVLINGSQEFYCQIYGEAERPLRRAQGRNILIGKNPRYVIEGFGMLFIVVIAYSLAHESDDAAKAIPVLGALVLAAQRLLPVMQQMYQSWSNINGGQASLNDVLEFLEQPLPDFAGQPDVTPLPFQESIRLEKLSFRYTPETHMVLENLTLTLPRGSRTGFIGATGSGKSTLIDIVMALLQPTEGALKIDGQLVTESNSHAWQAHIAHVPQAIFLADSTIAENIALGVPKEDIDYERVRQAARKAQIADVIEGWPEQYMAMVGERGIRLSGGQRQRIGIARALYKHADVIVFDEATSALDNETEQAVMQAIDGLGSDLTILIIAHRLTTLRNCTQIVELRHGRVLRMGSYQDIVSERKGGNEKHH